MIKRLLFGIMLAAVPLAIKAQASVENSKSFHERMEWFGQAKLGIFIHWGIYAVNGIDESWSFYNGYISHEDYMKQKAGFTADAYNPEQWAKIIAKSGAQYAVLTSKHHDGVCLWDTKTTENNVVDGTPAARDLVAPFVEALREHDLKVGLYWSIIDWSDERYDGFTRSEKRYNIEEDPARFESFLKYNSAQLEELTTQFSPDLFWFDGDWEHSAKQWRSAELKKQLLEWNPKVIINSRIGGQYGDYATPEQGVPIVRPGADYWELCYTINNSWGYQANDNNWKSPQQLLRVFIDCISMGGNLLLDIGPRADGSIPEEQLAVLEHLGRWTSKHADAVYPTVAGLPQGHYRGASTFDPEKKILYLFMDGKPNDRLLVKGLKNSVQRAWVVGEGERLDTEVVGKLYWSQIPGLLYVDVPTDEALDQDVTVIALLLDGDLTLYREEVKAIESN